MYDVNQLQTDGLSPLSDSFTQKLRDECAIDINVDYDNFKVRASNWLLASNHRKIHGLDSFPKLDIIMGCNHFIDNILIMNGKNNVQIFEHDYGYYKKISPDINYVTVETLQADKPLLMSFPFTGSLGIPKNFLEIVEACNQLNIDLHLDGAWMPAAFNIDCNIDFPCVKSFAMSFSKAIAMSWNRIGVRWTRESSIDNVTLFNNKLMIPHCTLGVANYVMDHTTVDYFIDNYHSKYMDICRSLKLRPTNIIHAAMSIDRKRLYGLKNLLTS